MVKLNEAVKRLAKCLVESCPTQQLKQLTSTEDGQVQLQLTDADDRKIVVNLVFLDPDEYPRSGALVQVDEGDSKCTSSMVEKLSALSERLQDGAQLFAVIAKVSSNQCFSLSHIPTIGSARPPCKARCMTCTPRSSTCMLNIVQVCGVLDIPVDEDTLRAAEKAASGAADDGEESGSAMEDDASDDVSRTSARPAAGHQPSRAGWIRVMQCWMPGAA
jgi:hypothetical protein